jgi:hypothetical protein
MKSAIQRCLDLINGFIWLVGCLTLISYAFDHFAYLLFHGFLGIVFCWSIWKYIIQPYREGLKGS